MNDSFKSKSTLKVGSTSYTIFRLSALKKDLSRLPFSIRILLENLLRNEDGKAVCKADIEALALWGQSPKKGTVPREIAFTPARVVLQDFTGVPAVVDLAAMRDQMVKMGGDPTKINPLEPVDLVIDHSVQVDAFASPQAFQENVRIEYERNQERYRFLNWGQKAFQDFRVVPPGTGIVHQVNLEYLASVVMTKQGGQSPGQSPQGTVPDLLPDLLAYPDTLVGTDSHTTMINGLGVLGWGVGGIEAEAAMLGQPISMLIPEVVGFKLKGKLPDGATATDLVLTVTKMLRKKGVVGKFVEFYGLGLDALSLADRATVANMAPEYGATMGFFPVDSETLRYLQLSGRSDNLVQRVEAYLKEQGLFRTPNTPDPEFSDSLELDLNEVIPCLAGPKRPQDRVPLKDVKISFEEALKSTFGVETNGNVSVKSPEGNFELKHGSVVIAAITSCTNTSNPAVMLGAGILAKKAVEKGLDRKPWVKTSLAPGSKVVTDYLKASGLMPYLEKAGFYLVGYGCTTCIGNSGPLLEPVGNAVKENNLVAVAVLSGNRNFEGRVNPLVRANYLASPPLVVAYALAGDMTIDIFKEPLGLNPQGKPIFLKDVWPSKEELSQAMNQVDAQMFRKQYANVFQGDTEWQAIKVKASDTYAWEPDSTYIKRPNYFDEMPEKPAPLKDIENARVLVMVGDSITTDHISPAGSIAKDSPAAKYLIEHGVLPKDFNSYGARRGNHEVMVRGTFANIRLRNFLAPDTEGGWTRLLPEGKQTTIYEAYLEYQKRNTPLIVLAGQEYGTGSSRDWAAKGPALLGVKAVIAESFERIHRSNLIGMGVLPLEFLDGENRESLGLTGEECFTITGIAKDLKAGKKLTVNCRRVILSEPKSFDKLRMVSKVEPNLRDPSSPQDVGRIRPLAGALPPAGGKARQGRQDDISFQVLCRIDTPVELAYYQHGGILHYVLRQLINNQ